MTKPLDARGHAIADYATAVSFMAAAHPGGQVRTLSFRAHGVVDRVLTAATAAGPALLGFANDREALIFYGHAAAETGVIAATDFADASMAR